MSGEKHAVLSASSSHRWLNCNPSARLELEFGDSESEAAAEGTAAHALAEHKLRRAFKMRSKRPVSRFDSDEMEAHTDGYVEFVLESLEQVRHRCSDPVVLIEQRLDFSCYVPDGFGTGDCVIIGDGALHIIDLKYGQGLLVEAEENPQMKLYALGALAIFDALYDISKVSMTICQPRRENVSTWTIPVDALRDWAENELRPKAVRANNGEGEFLPGEWCRFCKAAVKCRARADAMLTLASRDFARPPLISDSEIEEILSVLDELAKWAEDIRAYALDDLLNNLTSYPAGQTACVDAVDGILGNCLVLTPFSGFTDIGGERVIDGWTRVNPVSALLDPETGAAALWGAELVRDNFDFFLLRDAGLNRGVRIEYAKNLLGVSCEVDASDVVTRIVPVGKDKSGKDLLLTTGSYNVDGMVYTIAADQTWIDTPRASLYPTPHVQALTCSGECKETKTVTKTAVRIRMIREALAALANDADLPKVSLKVEFLSLGDTEEYAQYRSLEDVFLYDRVRVKNPGIQLDVLTEVNRVEFDCLGEKFRSIELGSVRQDMRKTAVASWQLPSTISGRKIAMESISAAQLEPESVEEIDLSTNGSVIGVAEQTVGITLSIVASRGGVLTAEVPETVLAAKVLRGATDLTASYDASRFSWTRSSPDAYGDTLWNAAHRGTKSITVTAADVKRQAVFHCTLEEE